MYMRSNTLKNSSMRTNQRGILCGGCGS
jgi:hypothetical protein